MNFDWKSRKTNKILLFLKMFKRYLICIKSLNISMLRLECERPIKLYIYCFHSLKINGPNCKCILIGFRWKKDPYRLISTPFFLDSASLFNLLIFNCIRLLPILLDDEKIYHYTNLNMKYRNPQFMYRMNPL